MNHDSKHNDFEYEKETFPKTPEHFKQLVVNQVAQEQQKKIFSYKIQKEMDAGKSCCRNYCMRYYGNHRRLCRN